MAKPTHKSAQKKAAKTSASPVKQDKQNLGTQKQGMVEAKSSGFNTAKFNPARFVREVRSEVKKVVWPTRKEVGIGTVMVLVMAGIMAVFFLVVDQLIAWLIQLLI